MISSFCYLFPAWFFSQFKTSGAGEGRSVLAIFQVRKALKLLGIAMNSEDEMVGLSQTGETTVTPEDLEALGDHIGAEKWRSKLHGSVRAFNVSKTFSTVQAVHEVSLSAYPGQVFALLGHNGAGKAQWSI